MCLQKCEGEVGEVIQKVHQGMCDDLNTPQAISALSAPLKTVNDLLSTKKGRKAKGRLQTLAQYQLGLQRTLGLLGMQVAKPQQQLDEIRHLALLRSVCGFPFPFCSHLLGNCYVTSLKVVTVS